MKTIAIPQFYCGPSGQKGLYNRQEVGLARAFAALGCRAVVLYPAPGAAAPTVENPEPNVKIYYLPVRKLGAQAFFSSWQVLLDEQVDAVHVMGDNSPGVPSLYRFCRKHGILFYSQLGALKSTSGRAAVRAVMDLLLRRNLAVYKKTPTFAKTPAVAAELQSLGVPCAGLMPVGLDTAIIPDVPGTRADLRRALKLDVDAKIFVFVGRLDAYKKPLDLVPLLEAMFAGCPPVARHAPGPDLIIEDGLSGWLCSTVPQLAEALGRVTPEMGAAAQRRINEHFLWQNSAELALTLLPAKGNRHG